MLVLNSTRFPSPASPGGSRVLWCETFSYADSGALSSGSGGNWSTTGTEPYQVANGKASVTGAVTTSNALGTDVPAGGFRQTFDARLAWQLDFDFYCADAGTVGAFGITGEIKPEGQSNAWGLQFFIANGGIVVGIEAGAGIIAASSHTYAGTGSPSAANGHYTLQRATASGALNVFKDGSWLFSYQPAAGAAGQYPLLYATGSLPGAAPRPGAFTLDNLTLIATAG